MMNPLLILQCDFENQKHITLKNVENENTIKIDKEERCKSNRLKDLTKFTNTRIEEIYI
jgi:hypothetical protein